MLCWKSLWPLAQAPSLAFVVLFPFFLNSDTRPFSLHLTRNASSSVFAQVMAEAKRLALSPMSSSDWRICTYIHIEQYKNQCIFAPRTWVSAGQEHIIPRALIQHLRSQARCSANFDFDIAVSKQIEYNPILWKDTQALFCYLIR